MDGKKETHWYDFSSDFYHKMQQIIYHILSLLIITYYRTIFSEYARVTKVLTALAKGKDSNGDIDCEHEEKTRHSIEGGENLTKFYLDENKKNDKIEESKAPFGEGSSEEKIENLYAKKETKHQDEKFLQNLYHVQVNQFILFHRESHLINSN